MKLKTVCLVLLCTLLLTHCRMLRRTTEVSREQRFEMPKSGIVYYVVVPMEQLPLLGCEAHAMGCAMGIGTNRVTLYIGDGGWPDETKHWAEHEFNHVVYGPLHTRRSERAAGTVNALEDTCH
ncbi:hypothetical protein [Ferrimonas gelatinilytica]|uniref:Uncharacterized protein n=1 Tax=Ferrimonas gelatinilytica TaxID=1255257 RepID=A0ABP9RVT9_9GAMM